MTVEPTPATSALAPDVGDEAAATVDFSGSATTRGARLSLVTQVATQVGSVVATAFLARLLTPSEFGIVAISQSVLGVAALLSLSGVNAALVTRRADVARAADTYFWCALVSGVLLVGLFAVVAVPACAALGQRSAAPYVIVLAVSFAVGLLALVPNALLQRAAGFRWLNLALLAGAAVYFVTEVLLAWWGAGAWAVVVGQLAGSVTGLVTAMLGARWVPGSRFSVQILRQDLRTTGTLSISQVATYVQQNVDYWTVSARFGSAALGAYYVAFVLPSLVRQRISATVRQVMLPAYAAASSEDAVARLWARTVPVSFGVGVPVLVIIAVAAQPIVDVLFGDQWDDAVTPMRVLTLVAAGDMLLGSVGTVAIARRVLRRFLVVQLFKATMTAALAVLAVTQVATVEAVAWAVALATLAACVVQDVVLARPLGIGLSALGTDLARYVGMSAAMALAMIGAAMVLPASTPSWAQLSALVVTGGLAYGAVGGLAARALLLVIVKDGWRLVRGR